MKQLRYFFMIAVAALFAVTALAQPAKIAYQAVIRDADGKALVSKKVNVRFALLRAADDPIDNALYHETHTLTTSPTGLLSAEVGGGTVGQGNIEEIDWSESYFLKVEIDTRGTGTYNMSLVQRLLSVPYALYAPTNEKVLYDIKALEARQMSLINRLKKENEINDFNGKNYSTWKILDSKWMVNSLASETLNDGTAINKLTTTDWANADHTTPQRKVFGDKPENSKLFGYLYNFAAVQTGKLCPDGWHVPTKAEYEKLLKKYPDANQWKSKDSQLWKDASWNTDETGFSAGGGSNIDANGKEDPEDFKTSVIFWTATEASADMAYVLQITSTGQVLVQGQLKKLGAYVRCVEGGPATATTYKLDVQISPAGAATWEVDPNGKHEDGIIIPFKLKVNPGYSATPKWLRKTTNGNVELTGDLNPGQGSIEGKMKMIAEDATVIVEFEKLSASTTVDFAGESYEAKLIAGQSWLTSNIRVLPAGAAPKAADKATWVEDGQANLGGKAWGYFDFDEGNKNLGAILNKRVISSSPDKVCPAGYALPTKAAIEALKTELAGSNGDKVLADLAPQMNGWVDSQGVWHKDNKAYFWGQRDSSPFVYFTIDSNKKIEVFEKEISSSANPDHSGYGFNIRCMK